MRTTQRIIPGLLVIALISMAGICSAAQTAPAGDRVTMSTSAVDGQGSGAQDDIPPYDGPISAASPLYGLKIAFEDLDETFTFNETERLNKQMNHARLRLSEVRRELVLNDTDSADRALELYWQKINITQMRLSLLSSPDGTGFLHAQEMITKHQSVLENLLLTHPNNTGLARAYNNSLALERKFEEKTQVRFERIMEKNNMTILKAVRLEVRERGRMVNKGEDQPVQVEQTQDVRQGDGDGKDNGKGARVTMFPTVTRTPAEQAKETPSPAAPPDDKGGHNGKNTESDDRGQGSGKNR